MYNVIFVLRIPFISSDDDARVRRYRKRSSFLFRLFLYIVVLGMRDLIMKKCGFP
ncbi:hypothetical protein GQ43DRAFT_441785 [Delitschia confertaspora ATCC 74209]|uniref:Uncharacterized protein n=1 Tax=Delitschia confertaspora ATCC 74209 TaxID=1513339 RepID=A0A9P4JIW4_9PLEO|nr:hypothetical protein GQ43DRAFT_441785 [Delitschia confertaspora ATCC 74209]